MVTAGASKQIISSTNPLSFYQFNWSVFVRRRCKYYFYLISVAVIVYVVNYHYNGLTTLGSSNHSKGDRVESTTAPLTEPPLVAEEAVTCKIADLKPYDPLIIDALGKKDGYTKKLDTLNCQDNYPLLFDSSVEDVAMDDNEGQKPVSFYRPRLIPLRNLQEFTEMSISSCCYRLISRGNPDDPGSGPDHVVYLSPECFPVSLENDTDVDLNHEFVSVECRHTKPIVKRASGIILVDPENDTNTIVDMHAFVRPVPLERFNINNTLEANADKLNVLVLGLDAMSRLNFLRNFPKSYAYLKNTLSALSMDMYNKIGDNSLPNLGPLLTNQPTLPNDESTLQCEVDNAYDECPFIWQQFSKAGYHTLLAEDDRRLGIFNYLKTGFFTVPTTYYFRPFNSAADKYIATHNILFSQTCYGPRLSLQVMLDYLKKVIFRMETKGRNYFLFSWTSSLTHDFLNVGRLADELLLSFLTWVHTKGFLENTLLIVMGDHGARWGPIRRFYQGQLEERLPVMHLVVPQWFQDKYSRAYKNLQVNTKRLVTVWDLHKTFLDVLNLKKTSNDKKISEREDIRESTRQESGSLGKSLFLPISPRRTCAMAGIPESYCTCNHQIKPVSLEDPEVQYGAHFVVGTINKRLNSKGLTKCAKLSLSGISSAGKVSFGESKIWQGYQLNFQTMPGGGSFEALVVHDEQAMADRNWTVAGKVQRTNLYETQSWCVNDKQAKLYCYCDSSSNFVVNG